MTKISKAQFLPETQGTSFPGSLFCLPLEQERGNIFPEEGRKKTRTWERSWQHAQSQ